MNTKKISAESIMEATIDLIARKGLENASTRKIASDLSIAEGSIFHNFKTKECLIVSSLYYVDKQIDKALSEAPLYKDDIDKSAKSIWLAYLDFLVRHPSYTKFYRQVRHSSYFNEKTLSGQSVSFSYFVSQLNSGNYPIKIDSDIFWIYIIENTLNIAIHFSDGKLEYTNENIEETGRLIMNGISSCYIKN